MFLSPSLSRNYTPLSRTPPRLSCDPATISEFPGQNGSRAQFTEWPPGGRRLSRYMSNGIYIRLIYPHGIQYRIFNRMLVTKVGKQYLIRR